MEFAVGLIQHAVLEDDGETLVTDVRVDRVSDQWLVLDPGNASRRYADTEDFTTSGLS